MLDKQIMNMLNRMVQQMNPEQKDKLNNIMKDEESLKKAISSVDPQKARRAVRDLHLESEVTGDVGQLLETLKNDPELIKKIEKKPL